MPPTIQKQSALESVFGVSGGVDVSAPDRNGYVSLDQNGFIGLTTDDLTEGAVNLYFTDERVDDRVGALVQDTTSITWTYDDGANTLDANVSDDYVKRLAIQQNFLFMGG